MKLVAENLNEAIKHLAPKSEEEIKDLQANAEKELEKKLKNSSSITTPNELFQQAIEAESPKYILKALKTDAIKKSNYVAAFQEIYKIFLQNNFEEGIKFLIDEDSKNIDYFLDTATTYNIDIDKWAAKLIPLININNEYNTNMTAHNSELYRAVYYSVIRNKYKAVKLFIKYKIVRQVDIANMLIEAAISKDLNIQDYTEVIKIAFSNFDISDIPKASYKNPDYKGQKLRFDAPEIEREYLHRPNKKKIKIIISLMRAAKMDEKHIQPFIDILYKDTITAEKLIAHLQKYDKDIHIVINFDPEEFGLTSDRDYEHIISIKPVKNVSGDLLNIITTKYKY